MSLVWWNASPQGATEPAPPPPPPFAPDQITGLQGWWKADAITGLADGDPLTTWEDSHTSNYDLTQATAAKKPTYKTAILNGKPIVRFVTDDELRGTGALTPKHVFVVAKYSAATFASYDGLVTGTGGGAGEIVLIGVGGDDLFWNEATLTTVYHKNGVSQAEGGMEAPMNASAYMSISCAAGFSLTALQLGHDRSDAGRYWNGDVGEVILYDSVLSSADREQIEYYLARRWGFPLALRPNDDISNQWTITDGGAVEAWEVLDDAVLQPAAPVTGSNFVSEASDAQVFECHFETVTVGTVSSAKLWVYAAADTLTADPGATIRLLEGANILSTVVVPQNTAAAWYSATYTGSLTQAQVDDLRVRVTKHGALGIATVFAAYVDLTFTE